MYSRQNFGIGHKLSCCDEQKKKLIENEGSTFIPLPNPSFVVETISYAFNLKEKNSEFRGSTTKENVLARRLGIRW